VIDHVEAGALQLLTFEQRAHAVDHTARSLIVKEIAIAREQTEDQVKTEIEAIFPPHAATGARYTPAMMSALNG